MAEFKNYKFDSITAWLFLEQIKGAVSVLKKLYNNEIDNDRLVLTFPNQNLYDNTFCGKGWVCFVVPKCLFRFNVTPITLLKKKVWLKLIKREPIFLDTFYVSTLNERNKKNNFSTARGVLIGFMSNILSLFNKQPSSIIYILKK